MDCFGDTTLLFVSLTESCLSTLISSLALVVGCTSFTRLCALSGLLIPKSHVLWGVLMPPDQGDSALPGSLSYPWRQLGEALP